MTLPAVVAALLLTILGVFQVALAAGAPLGDMAWGGQQSGVLPRNLRIASGIAGMVVYPAFGAIILAGARVIGDDWLPFDPAIWLWPLVAFFALGAVVNAISRSPRERVWAPVSAAIAICCMLIAID